MKIHLIIVCSLIIAPCAHASTNKSAKTEESSSNMGAIVGLLLGVALAFKGKKLIKQGKVLKSHEPTVAEGIQKIHAGLVVLGMGAMSIAQSVADAKASKKSSQVADLTNQDAFDKDKIYVETDVTIDGSGLFAGPQGAAFKTKYKTALQTLKQKGISFDSTTGVVSTPQGEFDGFTLNGDTKSLRALGLSKKGINLVQDSFRTAQENASKEAATRSVAKVAPTEKFDLPAEQGLSLSLQDQLEGLDEKIKKAPKEGDLKKFPKLNKKYSLKGRSKKKKSRMYYRVPVGDRDNDIFEQITAAYSRKHYKNLFIPHP